MAQQALPVAGPLQPSANLEPQLATFIRQAIDSFQAPPETGALAEDLRAFYEGRDFQPAWMSADGRRAAEVWLARMASAHLDGLPQVYDAGSWENRLTTTAGTLGEVFARDVELTAAILRFSSHLAHGAAGEDPIRSIDVVEALRGVSDAGSARQALDRLVPQHVEYRELREALAHYRALASEGGWSAVPDDLVLALEADGEAGEPAAEEASSETRSRAEGIVAVCERLLSTGDLAGDAATVGPAPCGFRSGETPVYTGVLERAVRHFQARHGLLVDGVVGPETVAAMNRAVDDRIAQIAVNMDRWRRLPDDLGRTHVFVNIPAFYLEARDADRPMLSMRVVAGEPETPTPVMSDAISYLEFSPYWNVPDSITRNTLLPQIAGNPRYLVEQGFDVIRGWEEPADFVDPSTIDWQAAVEEFPYRLRQRPGPNNAMGLVKFMFPNDDAIYLHDTPAEHRFEERRRAFSHGCVRVEDPAALAGFLLRDEDAWPRNAVEAAMHDGERQVVTLPESVPVHLAYITAWVTDGVVQFRGDLYGLDDRERRALGLPTDPTP